MFEWYWALHGWDLILTSLGCIVGAFGFIFALAIGMGKWIFSVGEHDWRRCSCAGCQRRRNEAFRKQKDRDWPFISNSLQEGKADWCDTYEIQAGWRILTKSGKGYLIKAKRPGSEGFTIDLESLITPERHPSQVFVLYSAARRKYWRVVDKGEIE